MTFMIDEGEASLEFQVMPLVYFITELLNSSNFWVPPRAMLHMHEL